MPFILNIGFSVKKLSLRARLLKKWSPHGLAHFARVSVQPERSLTVDGNRLQHALPALTSREDHHGAVRREARAFVLLALREDLQVARGEILHADAIGALIERDHRELLAVRRDARARVIRARERDAF